MSDVAPPARTASRDRLLAFAFAGAELLVEIEPDATITWAAGAFQSRFGQSADGFVGSKIASLIAPADHAALARTLLGITMRGHTPPVVLHLNDATASPCALAALKLPGPRPRFCVTRCPTTCPTCPRACHRRWHPRA